MTVQAHEPTTCQMQVEAEFLLNFGTVVPPADGLFAFQFKLHNRLLSLQTVSWVLGLYYNGRLVDRGPLGTYANGKLVTTALGATGWAGQRVTVRLDQDQTINSQLLISPTATGSSIFPRRATMTGETNSTVFNQFVDEELIK